MQTTRDISTLGICTLFALAVAACGGSAPPPQDQKGEDEDVDVIGSIVGDVEVDPADLEEEDDGEIYTGPTKVTVNLKVVTETNPEGTFTLMDTAGNKPVENGVFGQEYEINQGLYSIEFKTPTVFGEPVYNTEIEVAGKKQEIKEVFPAGQLTLHTYKGKNPNGPCKSVTFSVQNVGGDEPVDVPGKGETCEPVILETGSYEILLDISKKKVQPVKAMVNAEQISTAPVKLEK
jgi:hypothetical protein